MRYLATACALLVSAPALAADPPKAVPVLPDLVMAAPLSCYVAALGGFGVAATQVSDDINKTPFASTGNTGTAAGGCDFKVDVFSIGAFGEYGIGRIKGATVSPGGNVELGLSNQWTLGGRLGYYVQSSTMLFASVGYTAAKARATAPGMELETDLSGIVVGGGLETKLSDRLFFRFDAMHYLYSKEKLDITTKADTTATAVRAGIAVKF